MACNDSHCCSQEEIRQQIINEISTWLKVPANTTSAAGVSYLPDINSVNRVTDDQGQITTTYTPTNQNSIIYDTAPTNINPILDEKINSIIDCLGKVAATGECDAPAGGGFAQGWQKFDSSILGICDDDGVTYLKPYVSFDGLCDGGTGMSCPTGAAAPPFIYLDDLLYLDSAFTQTLTIDTQFTGIDEFNAGQVLDTNIYELIPEQVSNVDRILAFFTEYQNLKGESTNPYPPFIDGDSDGVVDDFSDEDIEINYQSNHDISIDNLEGYIPRLSDDGADTGFNELDSTKTLQWLRDDLNKFLYDVDYVGTSVDTRPEYEDRSSGYLKIRNMNQAIIIRNEEDDTTGVENWETDGFTITMWVKFLDKVNGGTLFNYGNPYRDIGAQGFSLETFIGENDNRYVKLTAMVGDSLIDSHVGISATFPKVDLSTTTPVDSQYTEIPIDLNEWYFIVATYDKDKTDTITGNGQDNITDYWMGNCDDPTDVTCADKTYNSTHGNKCKVEIISKKDLLRARGFKQE